MCTIRAYLHLSVGLYVPVRTIGGWTGLRSSTGEDAWVSRAWVSKRYEGKKGLALSLYPGGREERVWDGEDGVYVRLVVSLLCWHVFFGLFTAI